MPPNKFEIKAEVIDTSVIPGFGKRTKIEVTVTDGSESKLSEIN